MAISDGRVKTNNLVNLTDKQYLSVTDRTKDSIPNTDKTFKPLAVTSKLTAKIGKKNVFDTTSPIDPGNAMRGISVYPEDGNSSCAKNRNTGPKLQDDRRLDAAVPDPGCGNSTDNSLISLSVLAHVTAGLPESKILAVEMMLGDQMRSGSRGTRHLSGVDQTAFTMTGVSSVQSALSEVGTTLSNKTNLKSLLSCVNKSGLNGLECNLILEIVLSGLLMQALCMSVNKLLDTIVDVAAEGTHVNGDIIRAVIGTFAGAKGRTAAEKVSILTQTTIALGPVSGSDLATTSTASTSLLSSLNDNYTDSKDPVKEQTDVLAVLDNVDPSWDKDSSGNTNMQKTKGNLYIEELNHNSLLSKSTDPNLIPDDPVASNDPNILRAKQIMAANMSKKPITTGDQIGIGSYN